jgi:hypothetical protein
MHFEQVVRTNRFYSYEQTTEFYQSCDNGCDHPYTVVVKGTDAGQELPHLICFTVLETPCHVTCGQAQTFCNSLLPAS